MAGPHVVSRALPHLSPGILGPVRRSHIGPHHPRKSYVLVFFEGPCREVKMKHWQDTPNLCKTHLPDLSKRESIKRRAPHMSSFTFQGAQENRFKFDQIIYLLQRIFKTAPPQSTGERNVFQKRSRRKNQGQSGEKNRKFIPWSRKILGKLRQSTSSGI